VGRMFRYLKWDPHSEMHLGTDKVIGGHRLEEVPQTIHSFRRTAASKMAENGATILEIMLAGGWKSDKIARTYVEKSMRTKVNFFYFFLYINKCFYLFLFLETYIRFA
jgi:hypothetical protein